MFERIKKKWSRIHVGRGEQYLINLHFGNTATVFQDLGKQD